MTSIKSLLALPFSKIVKRTVDKWSSQPIETQEKVFQELLKKASFSNQKLYFELKC